MSGVGHIAHHSQHLVQAAVQSGHLFPGGGIVIQGGQGEEALGGDHDGAEGFPQFLGRQGHGLELTAVGQLLQAEYIKCIHPGDGSAEALLADGQCQVETSALKCGVLLPAGADQAFQGVPLGEAQTGGPGVDMDDLIVSYAECGSAHQIQHFCGVVFVFHDDPPHGI